MELKNDDDSRFGRSLKAAFIGGLWGGGVVMVTRYCFNWTIGAADVIPGAVSGTLVAVIPTALLPRGFSLPKDLTAITYRSIGAFCLWVVADGIAKGKIHNVPGRYKGRSFMNLTSWSESPPVGFWLNVLIWGVIGCAMLIVPVFYFLKAIRDTSGLTPIPGEKTLLPLYRQWKELPENFQVIFVFTIALSSMLVAFYLLILLAPG